MIEKRKQIKNSLYYLLSLSGGLLSLITIPIFTRILSPADYGLLALAMIYASIINGLANFGMVTVFDRNYFQYVKDKLKLSQLFYSSIAFVLSNFAVFALLTFLFRSKISTFLTGSSQNGILILTALSSHFFLNTANNFYFTYLKNSEQAKIHTKYRLTSNILTWALSLLLVAYIQVGVIGILMAQLIVGFSLFVYLMYTHSKIIPFAINKQILIESLKISYPLTPRIFIVFLSTQLDKYMISLLASVSSLGIYHIGKQISELIFTFMTALQNVFNPHVYSLMFEGQESDSKTIGKYLTPFLYVSIFIALGLGLFAEEILIILTPENYHTASPIITILAMYFGMMFFGKITGTQLVYSKKTHITSLLAFLGMGINIAFVIPLTVRYGAVGAAWGTMIAGLISGAISLLIAQHYYRIFYEWTKIILIIVTFIFSSTAIAAMNLSGLPYLWQLYVKIPSLMLFLILGVKFKIISAENIKLINIFTRKSNIPGGTG